MSRVQHVGLRNECTMVQIVARYGDDKVSKTPLKNIVGMVLLLASQIQATQLSMSEAIDMALKNALSIKSFEADLSAQQNKQISAWLDLGPRLSATFNETRFDDKQTAQMGPSEMVIREDLARTGSLKLIQPITGLFALAQKARLEGKQRDIKESGLKLTTAQVAFKVAELYLTAQKNEALWKISKASIEAADAQAKEGASLLNAGRITRGDFLKIELSATQARVTEAKARAANEVAYFILQETIGYKGEEAFSIMPFVPSETVLPYAMPSLEDGFAQSVSNRLEVKQAQLVEDVASLGSQASLVSFLPSVNFFAQIDRNFGTPSFGGSKETKMIGLQASWDFFNSGAHFFLIRESERQLAKARYQGDIIKQQVRIELMQTTAVLNAAVEGIELAKKAMEQAQEAFRIEKVKFALGRGTATELVLAQTSFTAANTGLINALTDVKIQTLKLQQTLGKTRPEF